MQGVLWKIKLRAQKAIPSTVTARRQRKARNAVVSFELKKSGKHTRERSNTGLGYNVVPPAEPKRTPHFEDENAMGVGYIVPHRQRKHGETEIIK